VFQFFIQVFFLLLFQPVAVTILVSFSFTLPLSSGHTRFYILLHTLVQTHYSIWLQPFHIVPSIFSAPLHLCVWVLSSHTWQLQGCMDKIT